jgi:hypothetical protein
MHDFRKHLRSLIAVCNITIAWRCWQAHERHNFICAFCFVFLT